MSNTEEEKCRQLYSQGKFEEARICWIRYGKEMERENYFALAGDAYRRANAFDDRIRVLLLDMKGDALNATQVLQREIAKLEDEDSLDAAVLCEKTGNLCEKNNLPEEAFKFLYSAAKIHQVRGNQLEYQRLSAELLTKIRVILRLESTFELSITIIDMILELYIAHNQSARSILEVKTLRAKQLLADGDYEKAIPAFKELASTYEKDGAYGDAASILKKLASATSYKPSISEIWNENQIWLEAARLWKLAGQQEEYERAEVNAGLRTMSKYIENGKEYSRPGLLVLLEESEKSFFITGKAGSGKSTIIREFLNRTTKNVVVVTFTGVAAINVGGQTIHSFFRIDPHNMNEDRGSADITDQRFAHLEILIIDEISMVRMDLFEKIDSILRGCRDPARPFGGVRLILFGDYFQLPPISDDGKPNGGEYVFDSTAYSALKINNIRLTRHYRQKDKQFLAILDAVRKKSPGTSAALKALETRLVSNFQENDYLDSIILTTTRARAKELNDNQLAKLPGLIYSYQAEINKEDFDGDEQKLPAESTLKVKEGAKVIFIQNDPNSNWVNGTLGTVLALGDNAIAVRLSESGDKVIVTKREFDIFKHEYDAETGTIRKRGVGIMTQYPLRLAWAITIHKAQGQTYSSAILDFSDRAPWDHGQVYVALSRCKSLEGLFLKRPIIDSDVKVDPRVIDFLMKSGLSEELND